jgi:hypothetical protein
MLPSEAIEAALVRTKIRTLQCLNIVLDCGKVVFSIVFGRLYTAMHSFTDCATGVVMGAGIWWVHDGYWGLGAGALVEDIV